MAIFSSSGASLFVQAEYLPNVINTMPNVSFSGINCKIMTVTLEKETTYIDPKDLKYKKRKTQKIFVIDCDLPADLNIEIKEGITIGTTSTPPSTPTTLLTIFKIKLNPSARGSYIDPQSTNQAINKMHHPNAIINKQIPNPPIFVGSATMLKGEGVEQYESYSLPVLNFNQSRNEVYGVSKLSSDDALKQISILLAERNYMNTSWENITLGSLLGDLLQNTPKNYLKLMIVGNHQIVFKLTGAPALAATTNDGITPYIFRETHFTVGSVEDSEAKWNQFLIARADSLKKFIFKNKPDLNIELLPAQKINEGTNLMQWSSTLEKFILLNNSDDFIEATYDSEISNRFRDIGTQAVDIAKLDSLNLRKDVFPAGAVFIWDTLCVGRLQTIDVIFLPNSFDVFPNLTGIPQQDFEITEVRLNNQEAFDKIRIFLSLKDTDKITTNLGAITLTIEGYTDTVGAATSNITLSQSRAASVRTELENPSLISLPNGVTQGVPSATFVATEGYGETRLKVFTPNDTPNKENRRVSFRINTIAC